MRLIDADALMELARNHVSRTVDSNDIARIPTIDAVPVVHAKWVFDRPYHYKCSACNNMWSSVAMVMSYCPNCGAKMDGGAK